MPIAFILDTPGMTQEQYEIAHRQLGNPFEPGALVHIAGPMERGWCIVEVWPSQEAADHFFGSRRVQQAFQTAGIPPVQPIISVLHFWRPLASAIGRNKMAARRQYSMYEYSVCEYSTKV